MKKINFTLACLLMFVVTHAQNPVSWNFSATKKGAQVYEVRMSATIQAGWSIYSQGTPEGGPVPTTIVFGKNPLLNFDGTVKEEGAQQKKYEDLFKVNVLYYHDKVEFVQTVKVTKKIKTNITGTIEFMACNNVQCLPPKKQAFSVLLN